MSILIYTWSRTFDLNLSLIVSSVLASVEFSIWSPLVSGAQTGLTEEYIHPPFVSWNDCHGSVEMRRGYTGVHVFCPLRKSDPWPSQTYL